MSQIDYNRVVNVTVDVNDRFPAIANFSIPLILTQDAGDTEIATDAIKSFSSIDDMLAYGFTVDESAYQTAAAMLATSKAPRTFKVGYFETDIVADLRAINDIDSLWYAVLLDTLQSDSVQLIALNNYLIETRRIAFFDTNDTVLRDDGQDAASLGALLRAAQPSRLAGFYVDQGEGGTAGTAASAGSTQIANGYDPSLAFGGAPLTAKGFYPTDADFACIQLFYPPGWNGDTTNGPIEIDLTASGDDIHIQWPVFDLSGLGTDYTSSADIAVSKTILPEGSAVPSGDLPNKIRLTDGNFIAYDYDTTKYAAGEIIPFIRVNTHGALYHHTDPTFAPGSYVRTAASEAVAATAGTGQQYYAAKACSYVAQVNYNNPDSHYTLKFKRLAGALPAALTNAQVQNITGFLPGTGLNEAAGGFLNTYICTAGQNFVVEGAMSDGSFIDLTTFSDWLVATMQRRILSVFLQNKALSYDAQGITALFSEISATLDAALAAGALTDTRENEDGETLPAFEISVQEIASVDPALQNQRIAPVFEYCARYAGAIHYVDIVGTIKTAN